MLPRLIFAPGGASKEETYLFVALHQQFPAPSGLSKVRATPGEPLPLFDADPGQVIEQAFGGREFAMLGIDGSQDRRHEEDPQHVAVLAAGCAMGKSRNKKIKKLRRVIFSRRGARVDSRAGLVSTKAD